MTRRHYVGTRRKAPESQYYRLAVSFNKSKAFVSDWTYDLHRMYDFIGHFLVHRKDISQWVIERFEGGIVAGDHLENVCAIRA